MNRLKPFIPFFWAYRWEIALGMVALLVTDVLQLVLPWIIKTVIDLLPENPSSDTLLKYAGWLGLAAAGQAVARFGWRKYLFGPSRKIEVDILNKLFARFQKLDRTFYQQKKTGDLMSRSTNDLRAVKEFWGLNLLIIVDAAVVIVAAVSMMIYINPRLAAFSLLPLPLVSVLFFLFIKNINIRHKAIQEHLSEITSMVQENLAGIRVLHAFVQEQNEIRKFDQLNNEHIRKNMGLARLFGVFTPSLVMTTGIAALISLWIGGKEVIAGNLTLGSFVAFNSYLIMLSWPMMAVGFIVNLNQKGLTAMGRINEIMAAQSSLKESSTGERVDDLEGHIEFRQLSFTYPGTERPVLKDVQFDIRPGSRLALIGMIGSGKTSLVQLIPRIFDVPEGMLRIDGRPASDIPLDTLRRAIGFVDQEPFLFSATIRENIALGRPGVTSEEIDDMVTCAHLTPDLERWPQGLDTMVGERGVSLSGGQKQRIALARALIKRPKILILDDAFSSLDVETEKIILNNIRERIQNMTTLMVTHRLSMVQDMDQIVVMDGGRIAEAGSHAELVGKPGFYQRIFKNQALAREMDITLQ